MNASAQPRASLAAQVAAQARPVSVTPIRATTLPPSTAPIGINELDQRFRSLAVSQRKVWAESAFVAYRLAEANEWEKLGFDDEQAYCDHIGITIGHWRNLVMFGDRLQGLTIAEMQSLTFAAMQGLVKVHASIWGEYAWVEEAKHLPPKEFRLLVMQRNEKVCASLVEPRTQLTLRVPMSQHPVLERRLETIRRQERLGSTAEALNFALQSVDERYLLSDKLEEIQKQVAELSRIQESLRELPAERDARMESGVDDQIKARTRASTLTAQILRTIGEVSDEVHEEAIQTPDTGVAVQEI